MKNFLNDLLTSVVATLFLALIVCGAYPVVVWGVGQVLFHDKANGSLLFKDGKVVGSRLMAQGFSETQYFHPRPSAAGDGYDAANSGGSNLGPLSQKLIDAVKERTEKYRAINGLPPGAVVPADAVTASSSGLDPHISIGNALLQAPRVAQARRMPEDKVRTLIRKYTEGRDLAILGDPRVNVLLLNLALDEMK